ncbi:relaxase/mobilization nuclease domain-containing protein [Roseococcus sp. DSY-14]|uniref:relaxase/mobilization nuclease domain-containing protein n=1 Tax=Roseococcus sp. DSY-14 TaxID=3369650 RepID=UPI00387AC33D
MIIAATRIRSSSGAGPVLDHVLRGDGNDRVAIVQGTEADVADMVATARHAGATYAVRHYTLSPAKELNDADATDILHALGTEFGFDPAAALLVRHDKGRAATRLTRRTGAPLPPEAERADVHWHALVGEVDPVTLRVLDSRHWRARHEKVSRTAELRYGHPVVQGRWNRAVLDHLDRGDADQRRLADRLVAAGLRERVRPRAVYSSDQRRALERGRHDHRGSPLDLPLLVHQLRGAWYDPAVRDAEALRQRLRGLGVRVAVVPNGSAIGAADNPGSSRGRLVLEGWDRAAQRLYVVGSLHRLLRESPAKITARLASLALVPAEAGALPAQEKRIAGNIPSSRPTSPSPARGVIGPMGARPLPAPPRRVRQGVVGEPNPRPGR